MITKSSLLYIFFTIMFNMSCHLLPDSKPFEYQMVIIKNNTENNIEIEGFHNELNTNLMRLSLAKKDSVVVITEFPYPVSIFPRETFESLSLQVNSGIKKKLTCPGEFFMNCSNPQIQFLIRPSSEKSVFEKRDGKKIRKKYYFEIDEEDLSALN